MNLYGLTLASTLVGATGMILWRIQEGRTPVTSRKIVIPPLGMSTGLLMFAYPPTHMPLSWALGAVALGAGLLAWPLMATSRLERQGDQIWMRRSPTFLILLIGLIALRVALREYVGHFLTPVRTGALFYLLALGMVVRWRWSMWREFRRLSDAPTSAPDAPTLP